MMDSLLPMILGGSIISSTFTEVLKTNMGGFVFSDTPPWKRQNGALDEVVTVPLIGTIKPFNLQCLYWYGLTNGHRVAIEGGQPPSLWGFSGGPCLWPDSRPPFFIQDWKILVGWPVGNTGRPRPKTGVSFFFLCLPCGKIVSVNPMFVARFFSPKTNLSYQKS